MTRYLLPEVHCKLAGGHSGRSGENHLGVCGADIFNLPPVGFVQEIFVIPLVSLANYNSVAEV